MGRGVRRKGGIKDDIGVAIATLVAVALSAGATAVLAWKTWNLATATERMAKATLEEAETTAHSVDLQAQELEAVQAQAKLTEEQVRLAIDEFQAAQRDAWPELDADVRFTDWQNVVVKATVDYIHGSQPVYAVQVIIRRADHVLCGGKLGGVLAPMRPHDEPLIGPLPNDADWPAHIQQVELTDRDYQFAVTWTRTDRKPAYASWEVRGNGPREWVIGSRDLRRTPAH